MLNLALYFKELYARVECYWVMLPIADGVPRESVQTLAAVRPATEECHAVMGLDVGDKETHFCMLDPGGEFVAEGAVVTSDKGLRSLLAGRPRLRVVLEAGTHSGWIGRLAQALGHELIVANPRNLRLISRSDSKNDRNDARMLAHIAVAGPELIVAGAAALGQDAAGSGLGAGAGGGRGSTHEDRQRRARDREDQRCTAAEVFDGGVRGQSPRALPGGVERAVVALAADCGGVDTGDPALRQAGVQESQGRVSRAAAIETIDGVGPLTALTFVLVLDNDRTRFRRSRDVGCFIGLRPKQRDSGMHSPALGITKAAAGVAGLLGLDKCLRPRKFVDEGLHFVGGAFLAQEVEDDADGFFRGSPIDADIGDETRDQLVHNPLTPPALMAGYRYIERRSRR